MGGHVLWGWRVADIERPAGRRLHLPSIRAVVNEGGRTGHSIADFGLRNADSGFPIFNFQFPICGLPLAPGGAGQATGGQREFSIMGMSQEN